MKKMASIFMKEKRSPESRGAAKLRADWMLPFIPLTLVNDFWGTIWGSMAPTAGCWTAEPKARTAATSSISGKER
jgi:hypothetical protein